ncbi:MAG: protein kinase [Alphaproteobacteria bacterium]|nr:protein kinase [Alphaproteobacteria bacterium]
MDLAAGTVVDRYTVQSVLGEGGMAVVYLCRHNQLGTMHALKVLTMSSRTIRERLVQEGRVQALLRHPNVVAVTDIIMLNGAPGLVMEYIEGPSLDDLLGQGPLTYDQIDALAEGILQGVAHAHAQGMVHRDLKPANIMLALEGHTLVPKVTDFGLAKLVEGNDGRAATRTGSTMGTPHYMSPEQVSDSKNVDGRTDVFALGAVLYEMCCNTRAFNGADLLQIFKAVAEARYTPPRELRSDLPDRMERAIVGALEPDRDKRIQSVNELLAVWKGQAMHAGATEPQAPAGPFSAEFVRSLKAHSGEKAPSVPSQATWDGSELQSAVSVESLFHDPVVEQAPPAAFPSRKKNDGVPATSMVSGTSIMVGGGAAFVLAAVGAIALVVGVLVVGGIVFTLSTADQPDVGTIEDLPPIPDPVLATAPTPDPAPTDAPVPAEPASPQPTTAAPTPSPGTRPAPATTAPVPAAPEPVAEIEPAPAPAAPEPAPSSSGFEPPPDLQHKTPSVREKAIGTIELDPGASATLVDLARNDPSRDVQIRAWQAVTKRQRSGVGDLRLQEKLVTDVLKGSVDFSMAEAAAAYAARGSDFDLLLSAYDRAGSVHRIRMANDLATVARRAGVNEHAKEELEQRKANASGMSGIPERNALQNAIESL